MKIKFKVGDKVKLKPNSWFLEHCKLTSNMFEYEIINANRYLTPSCKFYITHEQIKEIGLDQLEITRVFFIGVGATSKTKANIYIPKIFLESVEGARE